MEKMKINPFGGVLSGDGLTFLYGRKEASGRKEK
jgi:hypothetical protein